jgi:catechol 2,3-dioxygenase-like lactoylglutathione lyase family enzyme
MALQRMDNVLIVVDDLEAAKAFFAELGMELEGETTLEGPWVDRVVGLNDVRTDIAMMRTPDGHGRVELSKFHTPPAVRAEPESAPANALGIRRIMFAVDDIDDVVTRLRSHGGELSARSRSTRTSTGSASCVAPRASSSDWPSGSANPPRVRPGAASGFGGEADDGPRTRDLRLGKPTLYQLSYVRAPRQSSRADAAYEAGRGPPP